MPDGDDEVQAAPQPEAAPQAPVSGEFNPIEHREHTRAWLAGGLAVLLAILGVMLISMTAADALNLGEAKDLAAVIFSPIVVLTSTAVGFYFGVHHNGR
jgi:hypothetical protein